MNKQMSKSKSKPKISLKNNKTINKIWHPESTLVFKSSKEIIVIGRCEEGELIQLDDKSLDLCSHWKFKYIYYPSSLICIKDKLNMGNGFASYENFLHQN